MGSGYVLNFSDRTYADFFDEFVRRNINDSKYYAQGSSKAKRMRCFWDIESDAVVARLIDALVKHGLDERLLRPGESAEHAIDLAACRA